MYLTTKYNADHFQANLLQKKLFLEFFYDPRVTVDVSQALSLS